MITVLILYHELAVHDRDLHMLRMAVILYHESQKKAGGFRQTFAKKSKSDRNEDGWQKSVIEILREIC